MGYVSGPFGIRGWVNVVADTEYADSLFDYQIWWLGRDGSWKPYTLIEGCVHTKKLAAQFEGVNGRDQAFALKGCEIAVPRRPGAKRCSRPRRATIGRPYTLTPSTPGCGGWRRISASPAWTTRISPRSR